MYYGMLNCERQILHFEKQKKRKNPFEKMYLSLNYFGD